MILGALAACPVFAWAGDAPRDQIVAEINAVLGPYDTEKDGVLTVAVDNFYVQCLNSHFLRSLRCEAAGLKGEPWLHNVLTPERRALLKSLGFAPDSKSGNFVARFDAPVDAAMLADRIVRVLTEVYGAPEADIEVKADWLMSRRCQPRLRSGVDGGGSIFTPHWGFAQYAERNCRIRDETESADDADPGTLPGAPADGPVDLEATYAASMTAELERLEAGAKGDHHFAIFSIGAAYVQCQQDFDDDALYCEAASADAVGPSLARILTPERQKTLIEAGFDPPGRVMNFARLYPRSQYDAAATARALIGVLKAAYGYEGAPVLTLTTESVKDRPL